MTRPIRQVVVEDFEFKYLSITEDENRLMVRVLVPVPKDTAYSDVNNEEFFSTKSILHRYAIQEDSLFFVQAEGFFDKKTNLGEKWWEAGANIEFVTDSYLANQGLVSVVSKHRCCPNSLERSTEWLRRVGKKGLCQIYCRTKSERIIDAAKSFTSDVNGKVYTNFDRSRIVPLSSDELNLNVKASNFLITHPVIQVPPEVNPYEPFAGRITLIRGEDGLTASECNGDIWLVDSFSGYIINKRITVKNGVGYFWARALDLEDGDVMEFVVKDLAGQVFASCSTIVREEENE